jgi:hypothetical protein
VPLDELCAAHTSEPFVTLLLSRQKLFLRSVAACSTECVLLLAGIPLYGAPHWGLRGEAVTNV